MSNEAQGKDSMKIYLVFYQSTHLISKTGSLSLCGLQHKPGEMLHCISCEFLFVTHTQK